MFREEESIGIWETICDISRKGLNRDCGPMYILEQKVIEAIENIW